MEKILTSNKVRLRFLYLHLGLSLLPDAPVVSGELVEIMTTTITTAFHNLSCQPAGCPKETEMSTIKTPGEQSNQMIIQVYPEPVEYEKGH